MKYKFNHKSLSFEKETITLKKRLQKMLAFFFVGISYALVIILIYSYFFTSPKEKRLIRELDATEIKINSLEKKN